MIPTQIDQTNGTRDIPLTIGQVKRVLEWWCASQAFRDLVSANPEQAGNEYGIGFDPALVRPLWDPNTPEDAERAQHPVIQAYRTLFNSKTAWRDAIKEECSPDEPRFKAWRARQIARNALENGDFDKGIIHAPISIEISDGCSGGCWFCGVGATKLVESWPYEENADEWRKTLTMLRDKIGKGVKWGFCYWATDPLDNPDYEKFAGDFADITGMYPQTTTVQAQKHPERVRDLLKTSEARGCKVNRFSVLSLAQLRKIYSHFTPDDLTNVEIIMQMQDGVTPKADSGAFRQLAKTKAKVAHIERRKLTALSNPPTLLSECGEDAPESLPAHPATIACASGFLLNMVRRTVKLISPCRANEQWPLGYIVFEERSFTDTDDLERQIEAIMDRHMPLTISLGDHIRLNPAFTYKPVEGGFHVSSKLSALEIRRPDMAGYVGMIGEQLMDGDRTAAQIAMSAFFQYGVPESNTLSTLDLLSKKGMLVDQKGRIVGEPA